MELDAYWQAMLRSEVVVGAVVITPVGDPESGHPEGAAPTHVITAWNPDGRAHDPSRNERANRELAAALTALDLPFVEATGRALDGSWSEEGFWVRGTTRARACELGRRFGQVAVFEWDQPHVTAGQSGVLSVVACDDSMVVSRRSRVRPS